MNSAAIYEPTINVADDYRYKRFTTSLLFRDLRFRKNAAAPGNAFPQFELFATDGSILVNENVFGDSDVDDDRYRNCMGPLGQQLTGVRNEKL